MFQFQLSSDGRSLTILNLKPSISGFYQAQIDYGYGDIDSTFVYDVQIPGKNWWFKLIIDEIILVFLLTLVFKFQTKSVL